MIILHVLFNSEFVYLNIMLRHIFIKEIVNLLCKNLDIEKCMNWITLLLNQISNETCLFLFVS
jgi:hypothetical protein